MTEHVSPDEIEEKVGRARHPRAHYGRAVSREQRFYILHSQICKEDTPDLRDCAFSVALDTGLDLSVWEDLQDRPVLLQVREGRVVPATVS